MASIKMSWIWPWYTNLRLFQIFVNFNNLWCSKFFHINVNLIFLKQSIYFHHSFTSFHLITTYSRCLFSVTMSQQWHMPTGGSHSCVFLYKWLLWRYLSDTTMWVLVFSVFLLLSSIILVLCVCKHSISTLCTLSFEHSMSQIVYAINIIFSVPC